MPDLPSILADSDSGLVKLIGFLIVVAIWGIGALASAMAKKAQEAKRRQQTARLPADLDPAQRGAPTYGSPPTYGPPAYPTYGGGAQPYTGPGAPEPGYGGMPYGVPQGGWSADPAPVPVAVEAPRPRGKRRRSAAAVVPPPIPEAPPAAPPEPAPARPVAARPAGAAAEPAQIARLIRRPETLRAAIIVSEVLSPPLSLRDPTLRPPAR